MEPSSPQDGASRAKAADIPDLEFLDAIDTAIREHSAADDSWPLGAFTWDIATVLTGRPDLIGSNLSTQPWPNVPAKVVLAKARKLYRRGLIEGCVCGCRGEFVITLEGRMLQAYLRGEPPLLTAATITGAEIAAIAAFEASSFMDGSADTSKDHG